MQVNCDIWCRNRHLSAEICTALLEKRIWLTWHQLSDYACAEFVWDAPQSPCFGVQMLAYVQHFWLRLECRGIQVAVLLDWVGFDEEWMDRGILWRRSWCWNESWFTLFKRAAFTFSITYEPFPLVVVFDGPETGLLVIRISGAVGSDIFGRKKVVITWPPRYRDQMS